MSIASEISRLQTAKTDIKGAIEAKGVTVPSSAKLDTYDDYVAQIPSPPLAESDVNFYDYDGTLLRSYSAQSFANLEALPSNPSHDGLTAQGWNWTLSAAKTYVAAHGKLDIGQMYTTSNGETRLYLHIIATDGQKTGLYWNQTDSNGVEIYWGDGGGPTTNSGTGEVSAYHVYSSGGDYTIRVKPISGTFSFGWSSQTRTIFGATSNSQDQAASPALVKMELGASITGMVRYALQDCANLKYISIPNTFVSFGDNVFYRCHSLCSVVIPTSIDTIPSSTFYQCYSLESASLPEGLLQVKGSAFSNCSELRHVTIPDSVTEIGSNAFNKCSVLSYVSMPSTITTLGYNTFSYCYKIESISIPSGATTIPSAYFSSCYKLETVSIPSSVDTIEMSAFDNCRNLSSITIPDITTLPGSVFYNCYGLSELVLPATLTEISNYSAFYGLYNVKRFIFLATTPPSIPVYMFMYTDQNSQILVPASAVSTYKAATNWSSYASRISAIPTT